METSSTPSRAILPIPDVHPLFPGLITYDAKDPATSFPADPSGTAADGELRMCWVVLLDDVGFAASSAFGGPCDSPVAERLAATGLKLMTAHLNATALQLESTATAEANGDTTVGTGDDGK